MDGLVHDTAEKVLTTTRMAFAALDRGDDATAAKLFRSRSAIEQRLKASPLPEYGRLLAMRSGDIPMRGAGGGARSVDDITRRIHDAYAKGDKATASRLARQRDALARQIYGE